MSAPAPRFEIKDWYLGALRPMDRGDGLRAGVAVGSCVPRDTIRGARSRWRPNPSRRMSAPVLRFEPKGRCRGVLPPMQRGGGLLARVRPRRASLSRAEMQGIAGPAGEPAAVATRYAAAGRPIPEAAE